MIRKQVNLKKSLFRRLIKLITSDEELNFDDSFNVVAKKKDERCLKKQDRK